MRFDATARVFGKAAGLAMLMASAHVFVAPALVAPALAAGTRDLVVVTVDRARIARIPEKTQTLVIGQPGIADVTMLKNSGMGVITGKSFGETNLIALDGEGNMLGEWIIRVGAEKADLLVQNGTSRESYICAPNCLPTVELADNKGVAGDRAGAVSAHVGFSSGK
jgi:Flp pilus assembly secretin CpaC